jgi:hypothetical protein
MICAVFAASSDTCSIGSESSFFDRSAAGGALESEYRRNCDGPTRSADRTGHCTCGFGLKAIVRDRDVMLSRGGMVLVVVLRCRPHSSKMTRRQIEATSGTCHAGCLYLATTQRVAMNGVAVKIWGKVAEVCRTFRGQWCIQAGLFPLLTVDSDHLPDEPNQLLTFEMERKRLEHFLCSIHRERQNTLVGFACWASLPGN